MGLFDHSKTWRFSVRASSSDCLSAFVNAFSGGFHLAAAKWQVERSGNEATATYRGRAGIGKLASSLSSRAASEEEGAIGSGVSFTVEEDENERKTCAMWLSTSSKRLGFTSDARFFRPYMRAVERNLRNLDPTLSLAKD
ncbi:MAG: hypothetical protein WEB06_03120 [Actinomycetota bacterium]